LFVLLKLYFKSACGLILLLYLEFKGNEESETLL